MAIYNLYSKRNKPKSEETDVYLYDKLSQEIRTQIGFIWDDAIGIHEHDSYENWHPQKVYEELVRILRREYGVEQLIKGRFRHSRDELVAWFKHEGNIDRCLDAIELSFFQIDGYIRKYASHNTSQSPDDAIQELNARLREHCIGYQFESGKIIRVDNRFTHKEIVKPCLELLRDPAFQGANEEFLRAHEEYRKGHYRQSNHECGKAFESTMKAICEEQGWEYNTDKDTAKKLIKIVMDNGLIPKSLQTQFSHLHGLLENGPPVLRNKEGGHGKGVKTAEPEDFIVGYQINQTAAAIVLLVNAHTHLMKEK